jgi:hypothetical protein
MKKMGSIVLRKARKRGRDTGQPSKKPKLASSNSVQRRNNSPWASPIFGSKSTTVTAIDPCY